jgi:hypothetical protein
MRLVSILVLYESQFEAWDSLNQLTSVYFVSLMVFLSFFAFQLVVVALCEVFSQTKEAEKRKHDSYAIFVVNSVVEVVQSGPFAP